MYKENFGNIPNKDKIIYYLRENNPNFGKWVRRSFLIGKTAKNIANEIGLDKDIAYAIGCLYDIGNYEKETGAKQIIKAFDILRSETFFFPARIAISHNFVIKEINSYHDQMNISEKQKNLIENYLYKIEYNDYDKLIQVLDNSIEENYIGIEEKSKIILEKYGYNKFHKEKIEKLKGLREYFEQKLKHKISHYCK